MHIAAASPTPQYLSREQVPADAVEKEKAIYRAQVAAEGKPANIVEKIVDGKLGTFFAQGLGPQNFAVALAGGGRGWWEDDTGEEPWDFAGKGWGPEAVRLLGEYHRTLSVIISVNDEGVADNGVTRADDWPGDEHGPVPKVRYHMTPVTRERRDWLARKAAEVVRAAGANRVHRTDIQPILTHIMSTMRMGRDPATSVVDASGEAHEVERLFVGDSSVIPTVGGANPTLTAQALAARTADHIRTRYFA